MNQIVNRFLPTIFPKKPDLDFYPGCRVIVVCPEEKSKKRMIVTDVYPYIIRCRDVNKKIAFYNVGDVCCGMVQKVE